MDIASHATRRPGTRRVRHAPASTRLAGGDRRERVGWALDPPLGVRRWGLGAPVQPLGRFGDSRRWSRRRMSRRGSGRRGGNRRSYLRANVARTTSTVRRRSPLGSDDKCRQGRRPGPGDRHSVPTTNVARTASGPAITTRPLRQSRQEGVGADERRLLDDECRQGGRECGRTPLGLDDECRSAGLGDPAIATRVARRMSWEPRAAPIATQALTTNVAPGASAGNPPGAGGARRRRRPGRRPRTVRARRPAR